MKYILKEHEVGETSTKDGINYTVDDVNPDTNQISWKVDYEPDFEIVYNQIMETSKLVEEIRVKIDDGSKFNNVKDLLEKAKHAYRAVLRRDYPKAYNTLLKTKVNEISTSGGVGPVQGKMKTYRLKNGKI